jgi:glucose-6-phosphate 1-dehydrogenase
MMTDSAQRATLVLFGGTGDLATSKLLPALFNLWKQGEIRDCLIVGVGRRCESTAAYRALLAEQVELASREPADWERFAGSVEFHQGEIQTGADFSALRSRLEELEGGRDLPGNRLFYYSVGPRWFVSITENLSRAGLLPRPAEGPSGHWTRIIVEKPFGHDLSSAVKLDDALHQYVDESQIYRIDHYLGKETVQNLIAFRFANGHIEPTWNHHYVDHVQITVAETVGIGHRAGYYEPAGALRDVMQNHMLQLLALTAMEPPNRLDPEALRDEKVKALDAIRLAGSARDVERDTIRGQYGAGTVDGKSVAGYRGEPGVADDSLTPTFVAARLYLDTWRWAGVPFLLRHGKRLRRRATEIAIQFKTPPLALFRTMEIPVRCANVLVLRIQPQEGICWRFGAKVPGRGMKLDDVEMDFSYEESFQARIPEAYERLVLDALLGDPTLFTRSDEVRSSWRWADSVIGAWEELDPPEFPNYPAGSWGPTEADRLFEGAPAAGQEFTCRMGWRQLA